LKRPAARPLADLVDACLAPALAAQGFAAADVVVGWPDIVGERLAGVCAPVKLQWPRRPPGIDPDSRGEPATLVVRVEGAFALELQHLAPVIVERINTRYGWRCVGRLALRQGPLARPQRPRPVPQPDAAMLARAEASVAGIADDGLRQALARFGAGVMARGDEP
jgi:hypothetical protein